jgi:hypothetical protein
MMKPGRPNSGATDLPDAPSSQSQQIFAGVIEGFLRTADSTDDPLARLRNQSLAKILADRQKWRFVQQWEKLFKLYRHANGTWKAILDSDLDERRRTLEDGLPADEVNLNSRREALEAIIYLAASEQPRGVPNLDDIPTPAVGDKCNSLEIYRAAMQLFGAAIGPAIVCRTLRQNLATQLLQLLDGSRQERLDRAEVLKKEIGKVIDAFANEDHVALLHGNKRVHKSNKSLKPTAAWVIEGARQFVEQHQRLPKKGEIRQWLAEHMPEVKISDRSWPAVLKEAGLSGLPKNAAWSS